MIVIPAIDLLGGACVRLRQGDYGEAVRYAQADPLARARLFEEAGIRRIHIVDLDAARGAGKNNRGLIRQIRRAVSCRIEVGGGIRSQRDVEELLEAGADRLILGTVFVRDPQAAGEWIRKYGKKFIAGIDAKDGEVKIAGWQEGSGLGDTELARRAAALGAVAVIYTNISRDGMLCGPDIERSLAVGRAAGIPLILSGGISRAGDIQETAEKAENIITAVIAGKAVYEGKLDLAGLARIYPQDGAFEASW
jgi:phosphoribosylformimino-5-aminoimidazole carboxamide ribotide isomerase